MGKKPGVFAKPDALRTVREKDYTQEGFSAHLQATLDQIRRSNPTSVAVRGRALHFTTYSRIEGGLAGTTVATAHLIAMALNQEPTELFDLPPAATQTSQKSKFHIINDTELEGENKEDEREQIVTNAIDLGAKIDRKYIDLPFISILARPDFVERCGRGIEYQAAETRRIYLHENNATMYDDGKFFAVKGDGMEPLITSGDEVLAFEVPEDKWDSIQNCIIVISYGDNFRIKKIIGNDLDKKGVLVLRPYRDELAPFEVKRKDIHCIYEVREIHPKVRPAYL